MATTVNRPFREMGFLLDGRWHEEGEAFDVLSPFNRITVGTTYRAGPRHLEAAIEAAVRSFEVTRRLPAHERRRILTAVAEGIRRRSDEFSTTMALEAGKPIKAAHAEVDRAILTFTVAAEEAVRIGGEWLPLDRVSAGTGRAAIVRRFPIGPVAAITPFNFPLNLVAHKIAPAIAAGCTVVQKPSPHTPFCSLMLAELVEQAGWPAGALNVLSLSNDDARKMTTDERFKLLTFTGSAAVGWELKREAGKKRVTLELGGNAACIVHSDADLDHAAERIAAGGFSYAGQSCISAQRIFVQRSVERQFVDKLLTRVASLKVGDPMDPATDVGPLINADAVSRITKWVEEAVAGGAEVLSGGKGKDMFYEPTVLTHTSPQMKVNCEEIFGPVVVVEAYEDFAEAVRRANDTRFGLQAGVFTRDAALLFSAFETLEVGGVISNDVSSFRIDHMPYGGVKDSGFGREGLQSAIEDMTEPRILVLHTH
ncbi:MAG TPA: aldehyde dehydrogenase family protein [Candidatus Acidoferrales bacterium]|nr:aldehyde dehydrogenase family protein [Candidatus Acidoferrales bacterium]